MNIKTHKFYFYFLFFIIISILSALSIVQANTYVVEISLSLPDSVFTVNENISLRGSLSQANYSDNGTIASSLAKITNATINITIVNKTTRNYVSNYTLTTNNAGEFSTKSAFNSTALALPAPSAIGDYALITSYIDPNATRWFSEVEIHIVNQTLDVLRVSAQKAVYNPSETIVIESEALRVVGDKTLSIANVSVNGSLRNSSLATLSTFNCTTNANGRCSSTVTGPSTYGQYIIELENFKTFSSFSVVPFSYNLYMKDELGKSIKNVFALNEQGSVEVSITNASDSDIYKFSGYLVDSSGNVVKTISSTTLNSNNSFINTFTFTIDALTFAYGTYRATITVTKTGDGSITSSAPFEVRDWLISFNKKPVNSGFEYEYSSFPNTSLRFEAYPTYRSNGSVIQNINASFFAIALKDTLGNTIITTNISWNATCGKEGCYEFAFNSSTITGQYTLYVTLSHSGLLQTRSRIITIISGVLSGQSTDKDGMVKDLFGTNEFVYLTLTSYNATAAQINLSDAEAFIIRYMNGTEMNYTQVNNFSVVNSTNSVNEWAWNVTSQRLKLDVPKTGGVYTAFVFGNNKTMGTNIRFIVNPYDACTSAKDTPGTVNSGNYYVWQFKKTDTVYFELKIAQANNPTGKATALNNTNSSSTGLGAGCSIDTTSKQVVTNATITINEVRNAETGAVQNINASESNCQASDNSGGYSCTLKPLTKWESGVNTAAFVIQGADGTIGIATGKFETRAFYLYGYSSSWQNSPSSNITLNVQLYEAGGNWWGSSSGLGGTITLKKIEYMGRDGEWIWPPVDSGFNVSAVNSSSVTSGSGSITIPVRYALDSKWKTGYYRAVLKATTSSGDTDYGYAWFGVKLWDAYGMPIECTSVGCTYKNYYSSKENVTLYIKISPAGDYSYSYQGGVSLGGNVTVGVKSIRDCRTWPCKELNSSDYTAATIILNESSPWYWNANTQNQSKYLLGINATRGRWNTGWYSVVLNINGTDTGYAWFNAIAFYVETQPVSVSNGSANKYSIRGSQPMYFNVTSVKSFKSSYYNGSTYLRYNSSDSVNTTVSSASLSTWDQSTQKTITYTYPTNLNFTSISVNGSAVLNISLIGGSWLSGYYWGELTLRNNDNETSNGWLWFNVRPFRVQISSSSYSIDSDQCINATINVYDPDWSSSTAVSGNYSVTKVYENVWSGGSSSITTYTNYTNSSFNATANNTFCPNDGSWSSGSWGGYHYLNVLVKDNVQNDSETGWLSFRTIPFQISWGSIIGGTNKATNANVVVPVNLTKSTGATTIGNLTKLYQWRYDAATQYRGTKEEYVFSVGSCYSNVSGQCSINGTQNVTIYPPSGGWKIGYNYVYAEWTKQNDATSALQDWSGIYFEGREAYNGYFSNVDTSGTWKSQFNISENITIKLFVRDSSYNGIAVNITNVQYSLSGGNCYSEWCQSYSSATWALTGGGIQTSSDGSIITLKAPSGGWTRGDYYIRASVSGSAGSATITGGTVRVKDFTSMNISVVSPSNNATYTATSVSWNITTSRNAQCWLYVANYQNFYNWYCGSWNSTNGTAPSAQTSGACNQTLYPNYNGTSYYTEYVSDTYRSAYNGSTSNWTSGSTGLVTGSTTHRYTLNTTNWINQSYGIQSWCYDTDSNSASALAAFKVQQP